MQTQTFKTYEEALREANSTVNQEIKRKFVQREVLCHVGSMVEYILTKSWEDNAAPFSWDDVENYYVYPEYYGSYAEFAGGTEEQRDEEVKRLEELFGNFEEKEETETAEAIRREIDELTELETQPQEIFEWWAVTDYLADKLKERGEPVIDNGWDHIWGRCTSGQAILLDHVISEICADNGILEGQEHSWAENK